MNAYRVMIVDDEEPARLRLKDLLELETDMQVITEIGRGPDAIPSIQEHRPDVVFLDIHMPERGGLEIAREIASPDGPFIVFVTAYDRYAVDAFELHALDYLLKPFDDQRFADTLSRIRQRFVQQDLKAVHRKLNTLLKAKPQETQPQQSASWPTRIGVKHRGKMLFIPIEDIDFIAADGPYAAIHAGEHAYLLRETMNTLTERFDPNRFPRIHRSTIVNLHAVDCLVGLRYGEYNVRLKSGQERKISRSKRPHLIQLLSQLHDEE